MFNSHDFLNFISFLCVSGATRTSATPIQDVYTWTKTTTPWLNKLPTIFFGPKPSGFYVTLYLCQTQKNTPRYK